MCKTKRARLQPVDGIVGTMSNEWDAVKAYFANGVRRLVDHQIESFEDFVRNKLPLIVQSTAPITVWHEMNEKIRK